MLGSLPFDRLPNLETLIVQKNLKRAESKWDFPAVSEVSCSATQGRRTRGSEEVLQLCSAALTNLKECLACSVHRTPARRQSDTAVLELGHLLVFKSRVLIVVLDILTPGWEEWLTLHSEEMTSSSLKRQLRRVASLQPLREEKGRQDRFLRAFFCWVGIPAGSSKDPGCTQAWSSLTETCSKKT